MKPLARNILYLVALAALAGVILLCLNNSKRNEKVITCNGEIQVSFSGGKRFMTDDQIKDLITKEYGIITGVRSDSIDLNRIEEILMGKASIMKGDAYLGKNGTLNIVMSERQPVVRFLKQSESIYADAEGVVFPIEGAIPDLPIVDGKIPENQDDWTRGIASLVQWLSKSKTWYGSIVQIHSSENGDLTLIPREGKERFLFGQPVNIASKFARLEDYYKCIVPSKEEGYYSTVNVMYDGEIVCRK